MKTTTAIACFLMTLTTVLFSQDFPVIPDGEVIRYKTLMGKRNSRIEYSSQSIYRIREENRDFFLVKTNSSDQLTETRITTDSFIPVALNKTVYGQRSDINTNVSLLKEPQLSPDEIAVLDTNDLANVLRAYPFTNPRDMNLIFLATGQEMENMSFSVTYIGEETITLNNRQYDSWKLEMKAEMSGAMALFSSMIPKTYMWFSKEDSRHLLKMTGSRGPGAENAITLEMISYTK